MCLSLNFSASWTQGALSLGVSDFHFFPEKIHGSVQFLGLSHAVVDYDYQLHTNKQSKKCSHENYSFRAVGSCSCPDTCRPEVAHDHEDWCLQNHATQHCVMNYVMNCNQNKQTCRTSVTLAVTKSLIKAIINPHFYFQICKKVKTWLKIV